VFPESLDPLLARVIASPDDDAPRLAIADALESMGDRDRAAFIRDQCAYARLADDDARAAAWPPLAAALKAHAASWLGPLAAVADARCFWRGFVTTCNASPAGVVAHAAQLAREAPLRALDLEGPEGADDFAGFTALPFLDALRRLDFQEAWTAPQAARVLASPRLQGLEAVTLRDAEGFPEGTSALLAALPPAVRSLSLVGFINTDFDDACAAALASSEGCARLEDLRLWNCGLGPDGARALAASPHLRGLRALWLGLGQYTRNKIGPEGCAALAAPDALPALDTLDLDFNAVGDAGWRAWVDGGRLGRFVALRLQSCGLSDAGVAGMFAPGCLPALRTLDLSHNALTAETARAVAASPPPALTSLWLYGNPLGDRGVEALAAATWGPALTELNLQMVGMTAAGAEALITSPTLSGLRRIACDLQRPALPKEVVARLKARFGARAWQPPVTNLRAT
jgi:uncharacterized protein (TIGR02996 family)